MSRKSGDAGRPAGGARAPGEALARTPGGAEDARAREGARVGARSNGRSSSAAAAPDADPEPRRKVMGESGCMGSGEGGEQRRGEPSAEGNGWVGRGEAGALGEGGGDGGRMVGEWRGMVHSRRRWPDFPQPRQQRGSRQSATQWCLSGARQRKQHPEMERGGVFLVGEGSAGAAGESNISKYERLVAADAAVNGGGLAGASHPAPLPLSPSGRGHEGTAAPPAMPWQGDCTVKGTAGRPSKPEPELTAGTFHLNAERLVADRGKCFRALTGNGLFF
jgi:hypothetical protein